MEEGQRLVLRSDGASRGNPGHAAAGVVVEREDGTLVARGQRYLGIMTNNQAEYRALIMGLRAVRRYAPIAVAVSLDSELVVRQMRGEYRVRDALLLPLYEEARTAAAELARVTFAHVPRAQNALADALANEALDQHARGHEKSARARGRCVLGGAASMADQPAMDSIPTSFAALQQAFLPTKAAGLDKTVQFHFTGAEAGPWALHVHDDTVDYHQGTADNPQATVTIDSSDWLALLRGELNAVTAFMSGRIKVQGDMGLMMQFQNWFAR